MKKGICLGVLALQGDFAKHIEVLFALGVETCEVRKPEDLKLCDGLIIPGGESTVMLRQIDFIQMREPLLSFAKGHPIFGTCAGLIIMARQVHSFSLEPLQLLDIEVERNAFGRQVDSFQTEISLELMGDASSREERCVPAFFIRAPRIRVCGKGVQVLAQLEGEEPILVRQGDHLGATFHPELTSCYVVHAYFVEMVRKLLSNK